MAAVQAAQAVKEVAQMTEHLSLQLTRNLLRLAIFHISYIRELFPEEYFLDTSVPSLDMKVKKLLPMDLESRRLIDWMEKGVYDALKKKYLKTMLFILCEGEDGPIIEEYSFSFDYSATSEEVSMHMTKNGHHKKTLIKGNNTGEIDHEKMRKSACKMLRTLVTLMRTLDGVPNERTILVKLFYYDDVTPIDYEPPYFRSCTFDIKKPWQQTPLSMKAGEVNSKFITFSLKVKSTLDSCEDENEKRSAYVHVSTGACSEGSSDSADSDAGDYDCTADDTQDDADNCTLRQFDQVETRTFEDDDMTQDLKQETFNLETFKEWLLSRPLVDIHITDLLANFPEISERHTEELVTRMVKENFLIDLGKDKYKINRQAQAEDYNEAETIIESADKDQQDKTCHKIKEEDFMYMKALYYALPLDYVTIVQLQTNLGNEINYLATRKLVEKMVNDGYVEGTMANRKIGRRVIHSEQSLKKFEELQQTLFMHPQQSLNEQCTVKEINGASELGKSPLDTPLDDNQHPLNATRAKDGRQLLPQLILPTEDLDGSTCGALESFGSELTRYGVGSPTHKTEEMASSLEPKISKHANSRESHLNTNNSARIFSPLKQKAFCKRGLEFPDSQDTFDKDNDLPRKASMVEEPIYQAGKRHRRG